MENKPFDHGFTSESLKPPSGFEVIGYNKAMAQVLDYLKEATDFKPEKRLIDSVPLLQKISATLLDINKYYEAVPSEDEAKVNLLTGTKT